MYVLSMLFIVLLFIVVLIWDIQNVLEVLLGTRVLCNTVVLNELSVQCTVCCIVFLSSYLLKAVATSRHAQLITADSFGTTIMIIHAREEERLINHSTGNIQ